MIGDLIRTGIPFTALVAGNFIWHQVQISRLKARIEQLEQPRVRVKLPD